ncbi:hypothetical protein JNJ66_03790 [Candidatus Saccharibacteria bacterium]|nr:hypothetical protein [Candidatus Saccharibacteria bacterium]
MTTPVAGLHEFEVMAVNVETQPFVYRHEGCPQARLVANAELSLRLAAVSGLKRLRDWRGMIALFYTAMYGMLPIELLEEVRGLLVYQTLEEAVAHAARCRSEAIGQDAPVEVLCTWQGLTGMLDAGHDSRRAMIALMVRQQAHYP